MDSQVIMNGDGRATVTLPKKETKNWLARIWKVPFADVVNSDVLVTYKDNGEILIRIKPPVKS